MPLNRETTYRNAPGQASGLPLAGFDFVPQARNPRVVFENPGTKSMKLCITLLAASLLLLLPACETAENATADAGDVAGHAMTKTGSAIAHGGEKLENATQ